MDMHRSRGRLIRLIVSASVVWVAGCGGGGDAPQESSLTDVQRLGQALYFDSNLSNPKGMSCGSCHVPELGHSGTNGGTNGVSLGHLGAETLRNSMSTAYVGFVPAFSFKRVGTAPATRIVAVGGFRWDGGTGAALPGFSVGALGAPHLQNLSDSADLLARVTSSAYSGLFEAVYGTAALSDQSQIKARVGEALAAFQVSPELQPFTSKFDAVIQGKATYTAPEQRGLDLFVGKAKCSGCHEFNKTSTNPADSMFTDHEYRAIGVPRNKALAVNADPAFFDLGLCGPSKAKPVIPAEFAQETTAEAFCAKFRTPTLRNVAKRPTFMHNGVFRSLEEVVVFYATRSTNPQRWFGPAGVWDDAPAEYLGNLSRAGLFAGKPGDPDPLTPLEVNDLVAFMRAMNDGYSAK